METKTFYLVEVINGIHYNVGQGSYKWMQEDLQEAKNNGNTNYMYISENRFN